MIIYGLKDLDHYILQKDDVVDFRVENKHGELFHLKYNVEENFLMNKQNVLQVSLSVECCNDGIFRVLELDPYEFCSKHYGYTTYAGGWPYYKNYDYEAIANVVKALYTLIDTINMSKSAENHIPNIEECPSRESKIINYAKHKKIRTIKQDNNSKLMKV